MCTPPPTPFLKGTYWGTCSNQMKGKPRNKKTWNPEKTNSDQGGQRALSWQPGYRALSRLASGKGGNAKNEMERLYSELGLGVSKNYSCTCDRFVGRVGKNLNNRDIEN